MRTIVLALGFIIALVGGTSVVIFQAESDSLRNRLIRDNGAIMDQVQYLLEDRIADATKGWLPLGEDRRKRSTEIVAQSNHAQASANLWALVVAGALAVTAICAMSYSGGCRRRALALVALVCWCLGLALPILTLTVQADVASLGRLMLREETKSLLYLLERLWKEQNYLLVGLIGIFGILTPLVKTACQLLPDEFNATRNIGGALSKWALVDVLVVGLFVAYIGGQADKETHAALRLGFWFFSASALISLATPFLGGNPTQGVIRKDSERPHR